MSVDELFARTTTLPLNRKEKFYTATVLPGIICADGMRTFFKLLGREDVIPDLRPDTANIQIFTEYDLHDAVRGDSASTWRDLLDKLSGDTPDVMILVDASKPLLICIEAKFFTDPSVQSLRAQMTRQKISVIDPICSKIGCEVLHVALVTKSLSDELKHTQKHKVEDVVLGWHEITKAYCSDERAAYWVALLQYALKHELRFRALRRPSPSYQSGKMTAAAILDAFANPDCIIRYVGAKPRNWTRIHDDVLATGGMTRQVAISESETCPSPRYMSIENFVATVRCWRAMTTCTEHTRSVMPE